MLENWVKIFCQWKLVEQLGGQIGWSNWVEKKVDKFSEKNWVEKLGENIRWTILLKKVGGKNVQCTVYSVQ